MVFRRCEVFLERNSVAEYRPMKLNVVDEYNMSIISEYLFS
jgi:hypothetical protein